MTVRLNKFPLNPLRYVHGLKIVTQCLLIKILSTITIIIWHRAPHNHLADEIKGVLNLDFSQMAGGGGPLPHQGQLLRKNDHQNVFPFVVCECHSSQAIGVEAQVRRNLRRAKSIMKQTKSTA